MTLVPNVFNVIFQCGVFLLFPSITFGIGYWLIGRYWRDNKPFSLYAGAGLWGFVAFEIMLIGILLDPDTTYPLEWTKILMTSSIIGVGTFFVVFAILSMLSKGTKF